MTEHPEIQDGRRYRGNAKPNFVYIFYAKHNKNKLALISIGIKIFLHQCLPF